MLHQYLPKLNTFFNGAIVVNFFHSWYIYCKCQNFPQSSSVQGVHINPVFRKEMSVNFTKIQYAETEFLDEIQTKVLRVFVFDRKPCPLPYGLIKKSIQKPQVWELSRLCPETSTKLLVQEFGFWTCQRAVGVSLIFDVPMYGKPLTFSGAKIERKPTCQQI
jgi:hypothetical protein